MSVSAAGKALAWGLFTLHATAWATVYELPADGSAVFGTDQRIKATYKDTLLDSSSTMDPAPPTAGH